MGIVLKVPSEYCSTVYGLELSGIGGVGRFLAAKQRMELLARTEIVRAYHAGVIQEYRAWGVTTVSIDVEWRTAGDDRVCDLCAPLEGKIFTLDEVEGMIPLHPQCRCVAIPVRVH